MSIYRFFGQKLHITKIIWHQPKDKWFHFLITNNEYYILFRIIVNYITHYTKYIFLEFL
jgi:hypothetical protein